MLNSQLNYRPDHDDNEPIDAVLFLRPGQPAVRGRVIEIYDDGVKVLFPGQGVPRLALGHRVRLKLSNGRAPAPAYVIVKVLERHRAPSNCTVRFCFVLPKRVHTANEALALILNRRRDTRRTLQVPLPVRVWPHSLKDEGQGVSARLVDVSLSGLGLEIAANDDELLAQADRLVVEVVDDAQKPIVKLLVFVRNARYRGRKVVAYGCELAETCTQRHYHRLLDRLFDRERLPHLSTPTEEKPASTKRPVLKLVS